MSIWSAIEVCMVPDKSTHFSIRKFTKEYFKEDDYKLTFLVEREDYVEFTVSIRESRTFAFNYLDSYRIELLESGEMIQCQIIVGY